MVTNKKKLFLKCFIDCHSSSNCENRTNLPNRSYHRRFAVQKQFGEQPLKQTVGRVKVVGDLVLERLQWLDALDEHSVDRVKAEQVGLELQVHNRRTDLLNV